mgnify:CR=1 FL=1
MQLAKDKEIVSPSGIIWIKQSELERRLETATVRGIVTGVAVAFFAFVVVTVFR